MKMEFSPTSTQRSPNIDKLSPIHSCFVIKCKFKNPAILFCVNKQCKKDSIFTCCQQDCECYESHKKCLKANIDHVADELTDKILDATEIKSKIGDVFDKMIDKISDLRDHLLRVIDEELRFEWLRKEGVQFLDVIRDYRCEKDFTSKQSSIVWDVVTSSKNSEKYDSQAFDQLILRLDSFKNSFDKIMLNGVKTFNYLFKKFDVKQENHLFSNSYLQKPIQNNAAQLLSYSSVVWTIDEANKLIDMFPETIKNFRYLFNARENDFDLSEFFETYGNQPNTLIICRTNKDKVIGGFTPLSHQFTGTQTITKKGNQVVQDPSKQSFIFSLTNNHKFVLQNSEEAICRYKDKCYIYFGDSELCICNSSDVRECTANINVHYSNENYENNNEESNVMFQGNTSRFFTTKEWEVWKVQFGQEEVIEMMVNEEEKINEMFDSIDLRGYFK